MEVLANALLHRDYFINATIKVFIFEHRVEIRSPGKLPNSLSIPKIRSGLSIHRNSILSSLGQYLLPYSGLESGIQRVERLYPEVQWVNDKECEVQFGPAKQLIRLSASASKNKRSGKRNGQFHSQLLKGRHELARSM